MLTRTLLHLLAVSMLCLGASCERNPSPAPAPVAAPTPTPAPTTAPAATPQTPAPSVSNAELIKAAGISFPLPKGWVSQPPSSGMRLAEARVASDASKPADSATDCIVAFFSFGGSIEDNLTRWRGMVSDETGNPAKSTESTMKVGARTVHTIEMTGTYQEGMGMGAVTERKDWVFRGAIIDDDGQLVFVRMTGPKGLMVQQSEGWQSMLSGLK